MRDPNTAEPYDPKTIGRVREDMKLNDPSEAPTPHQRRLLAEIEQRYAPVTGKLRYLTTEEAAMIDALRADDDQYRHIIAVGDDPWDVTVRHPINERLLAEGPDGGLFECAVLDWAIEEHLDQGLYRLSTEGDAVIRIDG